MFKSTSPVILLAAFVAALAADVVLAIVAGSDAVATLGLSGIAVGLAGALAGVSPPHK
jgi:hypothetical protein